MEQNPQSRLRVCYYGREQQPLMALVSISAIRGEVLTDDVIGSVFGCGCRMHYWGV
jgi:hypothetical protein